MRGCRRALVALWVFWPLLLSPSGALPSRRRLQQRRDELAGDLDGFRRAGCDNFTGHVWQPLRPGFHLTAPYGWINDPHGGFQRQGVTHLFFQYNPRATQWGAPFWGHVASRDLARWTWLPPALLPDQHYDRGGVWSGSATLLDGGLPVLTYTAAGSEVEEMGNFFQQQAAAVPADPSDPLLAAWRKRPSNPFLRQVPPGGTNFQFRDPTEARDAVWAALASPANPRRLPASHYAIAVGVQAFCMGGAGIYSAPGMEGPWSYEGSLFNQLDLEPQINGQCDGVAAPLGNSTWRGPAYGGPCDQFGPSCRMWEVVDFLELEPGLFMLKWDDQSRSRGIFSMEWYVLGDGPWDYSALDPNPTPPSPSPSRGAAPRRFGPGTGGAGAAAEAGAGPRRAFGLAYSGYPNGTLGGGGASTGVTSDAANDGAEDFNYVEAGVASATKSLFRGELGGQKFAPMRTDYGSVYASSVFRTADGRQVMFSWVMETAAGCDGSCSDQHPEVFDRMGFKGALTLPRQLSFDRATKTLRAYPVPETEQLRGKQLFGVAGAAVAPLPAALTLLPEGKVAAQGAGGSSSSSSSSPGPITARQLEVHADFALLPPGSNSGAANASAANASTKSADAAAADASRAVGGGTRLAADEFAVGVRITTGAGSYTDVYLRGTVSQLQGSALPGPGGSPRHALTGLSVSVDRSRAGGESNASLAEGGPVPLPAAGALAWLLPDARLALSVWVDHSVVEVFALGGLARVTSRIYPAGDDVAWGVQAWAVPPTIFSGPNATDAAATTPAAAADASGMGSPAEGSAFAQSIGRQAYCWWCKIWYNTCSCQCGVPDPRCERQRQARSAAAAAEVAARAAAQAGGAAGRSERWAVQLDSRVWEVNNAWLPPSC